MAKKPKVVSSITELRKKFPGKNLHHREREILYAAGAKISGGGNRTVGYYVVNSPKGAFHFLYKSPEGPDFLVIG